MNGQKKYLSKDFYAYQIDFAAIAAGGVGTGNISIQADSDFRLEKTVYFTAIAAAGQTDSTRVIPLMTALITDTSSGRQLSSAAVPISSMFGIAQDPFIWETPHIFGARSTLTVSVSNFDAANTYVLRLTFIGTKLYYAG
jgi:hypothetical protein